jgi:hypothetical protein
VPARGSDPSQHDRTGCSVGHAGQSKYSSSEIGCISRRIGLSRPGNITPMNDLSATGAVRPRGCMPAIRHRHRSMPVGRPYPDADGRKPVAGLTRREIRRWIEPQRLFPSINQPSTVGERDSLELGMRAELAQDRLHVGTDSVQTQGETVGNRLIRESLSHDPEHLGLSPGQ